MNSLKEANAADGVKKGYSLTKFDKIAAVVFPVLAFLVTSMQRAVHPLFEI